MLLCEGGSIAQGNTAVRATPEGQRNQDVWKTRRAREQQQHSYGKAGVSPPMDSSQSPSNHMQNPRGAKGDRIRNVTDDPGWDPGTAKGKRTEEETKQM